MPLIVIRSLMPLHKLHRSIFFGPAVIVVVWIAVVATLDPAGSYPRMPQGPGLTVDEMFNVEQGVYLTEAMRGYGLGLLDLRSIREVFGQPEYLPDHPPLGRVWLGVHHQLARGIAPPSDPVAGSIAVTACARTGSATAFALTILLIGWFAGKHYGLLAGWSAALCLALMPRLGGHAHLASLETITNLTCSLAVLCVADRWSGPASPSLRSSLLAGAWLGLAFLTKIQAILLPLPIIVWALWRWRSVAIKPLSIWGVTAAVVFFVGWPWLWLDPLANLRGYFARTTARATLSVWYFGQQYQDFDVPWHYAWVMFAVTIPLATLLLGGYGLFARKATAEDHGVRWLLAVGIVLPLVVFSLPKIAVYDSERLFLNVFPLWAILAGRGAQLVYDRTSRKWIPGGVLAALLLWQAGAVIAYQPCGLSYYNLLTGGVAGAERLGLETTYWGDSITRTLLNEVVRAVPAGSRVMVAPVLHQFQLDDLERQSPILRRHGIRLIPYGTSPPAAEYLLLFRRRADLPDELRFGPVDAELRAETRRGGVQLAALYRLSGTSSP